MSSASDANASVLTDAPSLSETQERFFGLVTARQNVAADLEARGLSAGFVEDFITQDDKLDAVGRLDVYANMYFFRLLDNLAQDYPKLAAALGAEGFFELITEYLQTHHSRHPSVRFVGTHLAAFLRDPSQALRARPWFHAALGSLADLEWARVEAFDAADEAVLTVDDLRALDADLFPKLAMALCKSPAVTLLESDCAIDEVWRDPALLKSASPGSRRLLVWRQDNQVFHRVVDAQEGVMLDWVARTEPAFAALCEFLATTDGDEDAAARQAFNLLSRWVSAGILRDTRGANPSPHRRRGGGDHRGTIDKD